MLHGYVSLLGTFTLFIYKALNNRLTLSCSYNRLNSHSDGTHSLQWIHWASDVVIRFFQIHSVEEANSSTSWIHLEWPEGVYFKHIFIFRSTVPLISHISAKRVPLKAACDWEINGLSILHTTSQANSKCPNSCAVRYHICKQPTVEVKSLHTASYKICKMLIILPSERDHTKCMLLFI